MSGIGIYNTGMVRIELKDAAGNVVGSISYSKKKGAPKKRKLNYNFKQLSSMIMSAKTSGNAGKTVTKIRQKLAELYMKRKNSELDSAELESAIAHAESMLRVAKKRKKNLRTEELAERNAESPEEELLEELTEDGEEDGSLGAYLLSDEELEEMVSENMEEFTEDMEELQRRAEENIELTEELEEMSTALEGGMESADIEELKRKHRVDELRDIMKADMKYLKSMFDRLAREKAENGKGMSTGAAVNIGGVELPVIPSSIPPVTEGGNVDARV
ncbi:MAG: hypothetical protein IJ608_10835 [Lachnospiraceae bacterium]|nr:hypothetical protein [Lachnospiraceae bacterium]